MQGNKANCDKMTTARSLPTNYPPEVGSHALRALALLTRSTCPIARKATGLILAWALPPILLQFAFGADILWQNRLLVTMGLGVMTLYLATADTLAIGSGTWMINPARSFTLFLPGGLPVEEFIFFLVTNVLIVFGIVLGLANQSRLRFRAIFRRRA